MNMLETKTKAIKTTMKGSLAGYFIGMVIASVVLFALIPVVTAGISSAGLTGTNSTLAGLVITFLILAMIVAISGAMI